MLIIPGFAASAFTASQSAAAAPPLLARALPREDKTPRMARTLKPRARALAANPV